MTSEVKKNSSYVLRLTLVCVNLFNKCFDKNCYSTCMYILAHIKLTHYLLFHLYFTGYATGWPYCIILMESLPGQFILHFGDTGPIYYMYRTLEQS